ncbi:MAG TPA: enoyl-CoA hydratase/isomerase family protein [Xanthobacteraceae bacterium]|nr:enoyl-CoA hydratase/isomerase family protein [Xanthobacteraceae bacterium]
MIEASDSDGVRILRLAHGKASALDLELVVALKQAIEKAAAADPHAIVLTGSGHIFCAGVDLFRIVEGGADYVRRYLAAFAELMFALFTVERPLVVAANGHAIAGGAVLVAAGDYRLMAAGKGRFGYTELLVGVPFPPAAFEIIRFATPPSRQQEMLYTGRTYPPDETLARALVDEVVEQARLLDRAMEVAQQIGRVPHSAFAVTKRHLRAPALVRMREYEEVYGAEVVEAWASEKTRESVRAYLASTVRKN